MSVRIVEHPKPASSGKPRLVSDEDLQAFAEAVKAGHSATSDDDSVALANTSGAARQRASAVNEILAKEYKVTAELTTAVRQEEVTVGDKTVTRYRWTVGPLPAQQKRRGRKANSKNEKKAPA